MNKTLEEYKKEYNLSDIEAENLEIYLDRNHDFNSNPFGYTYDDGHPMNYIHALRKLYNKF